LKQRCNKFGRHVYFARKKYSNVCVKKPSNATSPSRET
jgi:hypothetical protein